MHANRARAERYATLSARASIIQEIRRFFFEKGYLEVETPYRIPSPAPEAHIDAAPSGTWFLQTSPEICMKRMIAEGYRRIFQICRCWRDGERGSKHLPEFTMLEWYRADADYLDLMAECEALIQSVACTVGKGNSLTLKGNVIDLGGPWERISVRDAFRRYGDTTMEEALERDLFDELMVEKIEPRLGLEKPTFIHDYPACRGALARLRTDDPTVAERFELYMGGLELANAFSELTDSREQHARFTQEAAYRGSMGKPVYPLPEKFLAEMHHMPSTAGIALGIDRLVMTLLDVETIDAVVAFTPEEL
jgi:lysyl-tRNA synthetase class 2